LIAGKAGSQRCRSVSTSHRKGLPLARRCPGGSRAAPLIAEPCGESSAFQGTITLKPSCSSCPPGVVNLIAEFIGSANRPEQFPADGLPEIAFLGRSNVGKSSLINAIVGKRGLAFTSNTPGRTQSINFYRVDARLYFVDLPGYGYARVPLAAKKEWAKLIEQYLEERRTLQLSFLILDARRGWMEKDLDLRNWLEAHRRPYLVVASKIDKLNQAEQLRGLKAIGQYAVPLPFSAITGRGVREIWQAISKTHQP
jgi:GTP-binding protein